MTTLLECESTSVGIRKEAELDRWRKYAHIREQGGIKDGRAIEIQNEIFNENIHYAISAAKRYTKNSMPYRSLIDPEDLESESKIGLLRAINTYDLNYETTFKTHAFTRINGAIIDGIRSLQEFPRIIARIRRAVAPYLERLTHELLRMATIDDVCERYPNIKIGEQTLRELASDPLIQASVFNQVERVTSFDGIGDDPNFDFDDVSIIELQIARIGKIPSPGERAQSVETLTKLMLFLEDTYERIVIYYYFYDNLTSPEIARTAKISPTWVSEKKESGLRKIRKEIRNNPAFAESLSLGITL